MQLQLQPYTPALYLPGGILGRFRSYPRVVRTPIPGAGYEANLVWGEQEINLHGTNGMKRPYQYGNYTVGVPLLGLGQEPGASIAPTPSEDSGVKSFVGIAKRIWQEAPPTVSYGPGRTVVQYAEGQPPINYAALVSYAKVAAVGMFVGMPVAAFFAYRAGERSRVRANRGRRRRRQ